MVNLVVGEVEHGLRLSFGLDRGQFARAVWPRGVEVMEVDRQDPCGCLNWSSTSRDLGVFVYQPAEQIATSEVKLGWRCRWW